MERQTARPGVAGSDRRFHPPPTPQQRHTLRQLGVEETSVRHAVYGPDVFAYVEDDHSTVRLQIGPDGGVVGQAVLDRAPSQSSA